MKMMTLILSALLFSGINAFAGQPSSCDDAKELESQVIAKAKEKLAGKVPAALLKTSYFSTNSQNIEDDNVNGGEIWTVEMTSATGRGTLKIHVVVEDGACAAE